MNLPTDIQGAFAYCEQVARDHYENFPVASRFLPRDRRPYLYSIYAFARAADDMADEGSLPAYERLRQIDRWEQSLDACFEGRATHPVFIALAETIARAGVPREPFRALLEAFRTDVTTRRFGGFTELLEYCENSANPVGRLVLYVFGKATPESLPLSDKICTGLQLANFWQDVTVDLMKGRIYIPLEDFDRFGYTESELGRRISTPFSGLIRYQVDRTEGFLRRGNPFSASWGVTSGSSSG